jgi:putative transposase
MPTFAELTGIHAHPEPARPEYSQLRAQASSKTCSAGQTVKTKLPLSVRVFTCEHCGPVLDRDINAARNLAALAVISGPGAAGPTPPGGNARQAGQKTRPRLAGGDETGTMHARTHGTARHGLSPEKGD